MIIDYKEDPEHAWEHEILDAETGEPLPMEYPWNKVFYADDEAGILRHYLCDGAGKVLIALESDPFVPLKVGDPITEPTCPAWQEVNRKIKIVAKEAAATTDGIS